MSNLVKKIRAFLCCGEEDRGPQTISAPTNFQKLEVELPGLSEHERHLIHNRPMPQTYPVNSSEAQHAAGLDRTKGHTRALSNSIKSVTTTAMSTVGAKGSGYSALANESSSILQHLNSELDGTSNEMKHLLPRSTGGRGTTSSNETVIAGCEEEDEGTKTVVGTK